MIKRIIFDIDGTLLNTEKDCPEAYKEYFTNKNHPEVAHKIWDIIDDYEISKNPTFDKQELANHINKHLDFEFTKNDLEELLDLYGNHATLLHENIPKVLKELSQNYDLVALSKWYVKDQTSRLEKAGILKYFTQVYGIENAGIKPSEKAFLTACGSYAKEECLVVGDSIKSDIEVPYKIGMKTLFYNKKNISTPYLSITSLDEIKNKIRYILFNKELKYIKNDRIKNSAIKLLNKLPDYFFYIPASSSGKFHPICDLGPQGLIRHTKNVVRIGYELLNLEMYQNIFTKEEQDLIIYSLLFHDALKQGINETTYTIFEHPIVMSQYIKDNQKELLLTDEETTFISNGIASHMGQWNKKGNITMPKPSTESQKFIHLCDYLASRNFINIEYDNNENIKEDIRR